MHTNTPTITAAKSSRLNDAQAEIVGIELLHIEATDGCITPPAVVEAARPADSPLHPFFTWDDSEAAELYRLEEARRLIRAVVIIPDETPDAPPVRAFVSVQGVESDQRFDGAAYIGTVRALSEPAYRDQVLARAKDELVAFRKRYEHLKELAKVIAAIQEIEN